MMLMMAAFTGMVVGIFRAFLVDYTQPGKIYWGILAVLAAGAAAVAFLLGEQPLPTTRSDNQTFKMAVATAAVLLFLTAGGQIASMIGARRAMLLPAAMLALQLVAAFGILYGETSDNREAADVLAVMPVFFMCLLLLNVYKQHVSSQPQVGRYATEMLTYLFQTLAVYGVVSQRFIKKSRNFLITFSVLCTVILTSILFVSTVLTLTDYQYPLSFVEMVTLVAVATYCGTFYVFPPRLPKEDKQEAKKEPELPAAFFDHEKDDPVAPDLDAIIEEVKADRAAEEAAQQEDPQDIWDFLTEQTDRKDRGEDAQ